MLFKKLKFSFSYRSFGQKVQKTLSERGTVHTEYVKQNPRQSRCAKTWAENSSYQIKNCCQITKILPYVN